MFHLDNNSGISAMPKPAVQQSSATRWFTEGGGNNSPSWPGQDWFNIVQAELLNVLTTAGIAPEKTAFNQLALAIKAIINKDALLKDNLLSEIRTAGASSQKTARENLDITDATLNKKGLTQLSNAVDSTSEAQSATPKAVKIAMDNANARLAKDRNGADIPNVALFLQNVGLGETINLAKNAVPATRRVNSKPLTGDITLWASDVGALPIAGGQLNGALSIGTDNALGGNSIVLGDNDTGFKQDGDGILGIYANNARVGYIDNSGLHMSVDVLTNGAVRAGDGKKLSLTSNNNSTMTATFNLWGDANRPTVIELDDDQGWHLYSQRNPDGSIVFTVNGDITANTLRAGGAIYQNNGDIFGSVWGNSWLSLWINNNFVADVQLGAGTSVTTWNNAGSWPNTPGYVVTSVWKDAQGENIDGINYAPLQKRVGNQWYTVQGGTA
ncbi:tail fiber protein [Salmonella enterica]|nr:tail fiber protein [Salmonella enterica]EKM5391998.1 tail fiber protein [Salmonella enterica]ELK0434641.1 tail fiber protein [Salmonella enterica]ELK0559735.1 tail fiber protein [Salmonella enterica]ELK0586298.1 tail fiber protein [Salmonella enterica]